MKVETWRTSIDAIDSNPSGPESRMILLVICLTFLLSLRCFWWTIETICIHEYRNWNQLEHSHSDYVVFVIVWWFWMQLDSKACSGIVEPERCDWKIWYVKNRDDGFNNFDGEPYSKTLNREPSFESALISGAGISITTGHNGATQPTPSTPKTRTLGKEKWNFEGLKVLPEHPVRLQSSDFFWRDLTWCKKKIPILK